MIVKMLAMIAPMLPMIRIRGGNWWSGVAAAHSPVTHDTTCDTEWHTGATGTRHAQQLLFAKKVLEKVQECVTICKKHDRDTQVQPKHDMPNSGQAIAKHIILYRIFKRCINATMCKTHKWNYEEQHKGSIGIRPTPNNSLFQKTGHQHKMK